MPIIKITLGDGREVSAREMKFEALAEPWSEYRMEDGVRVRLRTPVLKIFRVVDDKGNPAFNEAGEPFVVVRSTRSVTATQE